MLMARKLDNKCGINTTMKFRFGGKNKTTTVHVDPINRYLVQARENTIEKDWIQFWTYIKYEMPIDHNPLKRVIGVKPYQLHKLKSRWGDKFRFEK